jgi:hypothetical protein
MKKRKPKTHHHEGKPKNYFRDAFDAKRVGEQMEVTINVEMRPGDKLIFAVPVDERAFLASLIKHAQKHPTRHSPKQCQHGYEFGHSAMCPGGSPSCEHGYTSGHSSTCPGGQ